MQDLASRAAAVAALLRRRGESVGVVESSAGGLINACLVAVPGASAYYLGGQVIYTVEARAALAGLTDGLPEGMRGSTEPYARMMAARLRQRLGATWVLAESGASGPAGNRYGDAAGHACFAVAGPVERSATLETGSPDREANMWAFTAAGLDLLRQCLEEAGSAG